MTSRILLFGHDSRAHESHSFTREKGGVISCLGRDVGLRSARSWPVLGVVSASGVLQVLVCTVCLLDQNGRLFSRLVRSKHVGL